VTRSFDPALQQLLTQHLPAALVAGNFLPLAGLTGLSGQIVWENSRLLARRQPDYPLPLVDRQREFRLLRKLSAQGMVAAPLAVNREWLLLPWQAGEPVTASLNTLRPSLLPLLNRLHHQPLTGYRLRLLPLLQRYWQLCEQRHYRWQRALRRLQMRGEPQPLRLAPLHMDIHAGNLLHTPQGLRLIDWEYAGDGDVALELASLLYASGERDCWLRDYAQMARLSLPVLRQQTARWQPWLELLAASWYQLRAEQSQDAQLIAAAQDAWQQLGQSHLSSAVRAGEII